MPATTASLNQSASPRSWLYPRDPDPGTSPPCSFCEHDLAVCVDGESCQISRSVLFYPRDPQPQRIPAPQFQILSAVTAVEVFEIGRDSLFMPVLQIAFWFGSDHLEVMTDTDGQPFQYSTLADALLTLRRMGWTGDVECTQMPY